MLLGGVERAAERAQLPAGFLRWFGSRRLTAKPDLVGKRPTLLGIIGGDHRIVLRQVERFTIAVRRVTVQPDVAAEHLVGLAVNHADEEARLDRRARGDGSLGLLRRGFGSRSAELAECGMDRRDQGRHLAGVNGIVGDMGRHDVGGERNQIVGLGISHSKLPLLSCRLCKGGIGSIEPDGAAMARLYCRRQKCLPGIANSGKIGWKHEPAAREGYVRHG
jgi:hypothetical protein